MNELSVVVEKDKLINMLCSNKIRFVKSYKALLNAYEKKATKYQEQYSTYVKKVKTQKLYTKKDEEPHPPMKPENRAKVYDFYVNMITNHRSTTIELSEEMYRKLWNDEWSWMPSHIHALSYYAADGDATIGEALLSYDAKGE